MRRILGLALLSLLAACSRPQPATPALWEVSGPHGEHGWLFGTIHLLPRKAAWRSPVIDRALDQADVLVLEIAAIDDSAAIQSAFASLAHSPGLPPLANRIAQPLRPALSKAMEEGHLDAGSLDGLETWAAALTLASATEQDGDTANGIDRAVINAAPNKPRAEFEGAARQLAIFDRLAEADQRVMLEATLREQNDEASEAQLAEAWRKGDMAAIASETRKGMLADPDLRKALFTDRNAAWEAQLEAMLRSGKHPFVAVGAAHLAGQDGLPAMLAARGWKVVRVQ